MSESPTTPPAAKGLLGWLVHNHVASMVVMLLILAGGILLLPKLRKEVFPEFDLDAIQVTVAYPGASPEEVEQGIVLAIEQAVSGLDGVKDVISTASEGVATVQIDLHLNADDQLVLSDVKSAVDRITSLPLDAEEPQVTLVLRRMMVVSLVVYGDKDDMTLRALAERARQELLNDDRLAQVELRSPPAREISIEVPQASLRAYGLTIEQIANAVRAASLELPAGAVKTRSGEVLIRTSERRDLADEFAAIVVAARPDGTTVRVRDLGAVKDGFQEDGPAGRYNGKNALMVDLYRVGEQSPIDIAEALKDFIAADSQNLPAGVSYTTWNDFSRMYKGRVELLLGNAAVGLVLVLIILTLFLNARLAFWVTMDIPVSFLGSLVLLPSFDVSINMVSLFGFIIVLGMVVDDAIVVGEATFQRIEAGEEPHAAAISAVKAMAMPVIFSVLTTVVAFLPLLFVPGTSGKFLRNVPLVVIAVLTISVIESLFLLPAHLAHAKIKREHGLLALLGKVQGKVNGSLNTFVERFYAPFLRGAMENRWLTLSCALGILIATIGLPVGQVLKFTFMPQIERDTIDCLIKLPYDSPRSETEAVVRRMEEAALRVADRHGGPESTIVGTFSTVGIGGNHLATFSLEMLPMGERAIGTNDFRREWQRELGEVVGVESISFDAQGGPGGGSGIDIELSHSDPRTLEHAAAQLAEALGQFEGTLNVDDGLSRGKSQLDVRLTPEGLAAGLTPQMVGRQLRAAFFGEEAVRQQRGRDEVRVYVRRPREERASEADIERFLLRTPQGAEMPLSLAVDMKRGRAFTEIERRNGRRIVHVMSELDTSVANANQIVASLSREALPRIVARHAGLTYDFGAGQRGQRETTGSLGSNYIFVLLAFFAMLAIAFRSYAQPLVVMVAIPLGLIGAFWGHVLMGYDLSLISMMGVVALSGVVVNASIVLIDGVNVARAEGLAPFDAMFDTCKKRFRPILLTSMTTFFGLVPMLTETSTQARFLIPMVISLAFGLVFATTLTLLVIPAGYLVADGAAEKSARVWRFLFGDDEPPTTRPPSEPAPRATP